DEHELRNLMYTAVHGNDGPFVIRYPKGRGELKEWHNPPRLLPIGKGRKLKEGIDIALLSIGTIGNRAARAIAKAEESGLRVAHYDMVFLKPIDEALLREVADRFRYVITVEEGTKKGGLGSAMLEFLAENGYQGVQVVQVGIDDRFVTHGTIRELHAITGIDEAGILATIQRVEKAIKKEKEITEFIQR
ncbi:MAG: 1-deoxy-D-xylulose-5-phosphate synthase, partial [Tissierellia bacterium]|nr:1-deoxy-D-xylulose-5-phosphate synthase [Tissierellia bacterium]